MTLRAQKVSGAFEERGPGDIVVLKQTLNIVQFYTIVNAMCIKWPLKRSSMLS